MKENKVQSRIDGNRIIYARHYDAPIDLVFTAWSDPKHLAKWWGPDGFTLTTSSMDFANGGIWEFVMHGPDGRDYKNRVEFVEINAPHSIVYRHLGDGGGAENLQFRTELRFEKSGAGTDLTMVQEFPSIEEMLRVDREYGAIEGAKQHAEKLAAYLAALQEG